MRVRACVGDCRCVRELVFSGVSPPCQRDVKAQGGGAGEGGTCLWGGNMVSLYTNRLH